MAEKPYIQRFRVRGYRCIQDCELKLTRLHALVGPNDSGKSTLLRALEQGQHLFDANVRFGGEAFPKSTIGWSDGLAVDRWEDQQGARAVWRDRASRVLLDGSPGSLDRADLASRRGEARMLRLDPDEMRLPSQLIPSAAGLNFTSERGGGLAGIYDGLLARKRKAFDAIEAQLIALFPLVTSLVLVSPTNTDKQLAVQLQAQEAPITAEYLSEGMLYYLAFAALQYLAPTPLVLVEEPENGLHPARIAEVMGVLRSVSSNMQVVIATQSPLVINELEGNEISIITRDASGTHASLLNEVPRYAERSSVYKNGELWLSYGDGEHETALLKGTPAQ